MRVRTDNIFWLGHDSVLLRGSKTIYFDPWEVAGPPADIICITHDHYDHCDPSTVIGLVGPRTQIVADAASVDKLQAAGIQSRFTVLEPGDEIEVLGVNIQAVPSYNVDKQFHPRLKHNLGFIVTLDGVSVYHAGDTDFIPEMADIRAQVALLPVSGTYVMTAEEAVKAALAIRPEVAIPMHYGKIVGDGEMAEKFAADLEGQVAVEIKPLTR